MNKSSFVAVFTTLFLLSFLTENTFATLFSICVIPFFFALYRRGEFPVLFIAVIFQWIAITIKVFYYDLKGWDFDYGHIFPAGIYDALTLSLIGLLFFIIGMWFPLRNLPVVKMEEIEKDISTISEPKLLLGYLGYTFLVTVFGSLFLSFGGLAQGIYILIQFKWCLYLLLFYVVFRKENSPYRLQLIFIIILELGLGFASYFSSFKEVIVFSFIGFIATAKRISIPKLASLGIVAFFVFQIGIVWTAVKGDYRKFLSGGESAQVVTVSKSDALEELYSLVGDISDKDLEEGELALIDRISYIDYFSGVIEYVPNYKPHENGEIWRKALLHIVTPRIFFPNKEAIDDSKQFNKYTGITVATAEQGVSFSLGYMADSYIDFGKTYMFVPILLLGLLVGLIYKYFLINGYSRIWGLVLGAPLFYFAGSYEMASIKVFGNLTMYFIVFYFLNKFGLPILDKFIRK